MNCQLPPRRTWIPDGQKCSLLALEACCHHILLAVIAKGKPRSRQRFCAVAAPTSREGGIPPSRRALSASWRNRCHHLRGRSRCSDASRGRVYSLKRNMYSQEQRGLPHSSTEGAGRSGSREQRRASRRGASGPKGGRGARAERFLATMRCRWQRLSAAGQSHHSTRGVSSLSFPNTCAGQGATAATNLAWKPHTGACQVQPTARLRR